MNWVTILLGELYSFSKDLLLIAIGKYKITEEKIKEPIKPMEPMPELPKIKISNREILYEVAVGSLGIDASPLDFAPDEFGCADSVNQIYKKAFGQTISDPGVSTTELYKIMLDDKVRFKKTNDPLPGDIIVSPTGFGNGNLSNGHIGIVAKFGIMSNESRSGLFRRNYTFASWNDRYRRIGGFPVVYFRCV